MRPLMSLVILALVLCGCSNSDSGDSVFPQRTIDQKYLFDAYYVNFAWGYQLAGTYIDNQGHVVRYDHSFERWDAEDYANLTPAELDEKYCSPQDTIAVIDFATLYEKFQKIEAASRGELSERTHVGYDMGGNSYVCYRYDEESGKYVSVLLTLTGDYTQENLSVEAAELKDWLEAILQ